MAVVQGTVVGRPSGEQESCPSVQATSVAPVAGQPVPVAQATIICPGKFNVIVPEGVQAGQMMPVQAPGGEIKQVRVPVGAVPGVTIVQVSFPPGEPTRVPEPEEGEDPPPELKREYPERLICMLLDLELCVCGPIRCKVKTVVIPAGLVAFILMTVAMNV